MRIPALALVLVLPAILRAQSSTELDRAAVARAKNVIASALDDRLPKVSLEFFLQYEAAGKPISWRVVECSEDSGDPAKGPVLDQTCVEAEFDRKHNGSVKVIVSVANSTKSQAAPAFVFATVTDTDGSPRRIRRLGDLPMELQRRAPRTPRDLPSTVAILALPANSESAA